jgi:hypothetical protein
MSIGALSPGVKGQGREANHSPPSSAKVKNGGAISPLPHMSYRGNFTFYLCSSKLIYEGNKNTKPSPTRKVSRLNEL